MKRFIKVQMPPTTIYMDIENQTFTDYVSNLIIHNKDVNKQNFIYLDCDKTVEQQIKRTILFKKYICTHIMNPEKQLNVCSLLDLQDTDIMTEKEVLADMSKISQSIKTDIAIDNILRKEARSFAKGLAEFESELFHI